MTPSAEERISLHEREAEQWERYAAAQARSGLPNLAQRCRERAEKERRQAEMLREEGGASG